MCGIFGFQTREEKKFDLKSLTQKLIKLSQRRGFDSSGVCIGSEGKYLILKKAQSGLDLVKSKKFKDLFSKKSREEKNHNLIGQCRLQTEGAKYISSNNQPITLGDISLVHNGIITNYDKISKEYQEENEEVKNYSDTYILTKYINSSLKKSDSVEELFNKLNQIAEGSYSIAFLNKKNDTLYLGTNTGTLYYLSSKDIFLFASERIFLENIKKSLSLEDSLEVLQLKPKKYLEIAKNKKNDTNSEKIKSVFIDLGIQNKQLKRCTHCILPETYPFIKFNDKGVCNFCITYLEKPKKVFSDKINFFLDKYRSKNSQPDCLVGLSGGRDSCYGLHVLKKHYGMNPIAYTYDWGLTSDISRINQAKITGALGVEHIIRSPDIQKKRDNICLNVNAWLKKPELGMVPIFMSGDKDFYEYGRILKKENNIKLTIFASGQIYEQRNFFIGFCGVKDYLEKTARLYDYPLKVKLQLALYYFYQYLTNPRYFNSSFVDTMKSFLTSFVYKDDFLYLFEYIKWDEQKIISTLKKEYNWTSDSQYGQNQWRMGDGQTQFTNYIFFKLAGFTEFDNFRSAQIRDNLISRKEGLALVEQDNKPKYEKIKEFCETVGLSTDKILTQIELIDKIY